MTVYIFNLKIQRCKFLDKFHVSTTVFSGSAAKKMAAGSHILIFSLRKETKKCIVWRQNVAGTSIFTKDPGDYAVLRQHIAVINQTIADLSASPGSVREPVIYVLAEFVR